MCCDASQDRLLSWLAVLQFSPTMCCVTHMKDRLIMLIMTSAKNDAPMPNKKMKKKWKKESCVTLNETLAPHVYETLYEALPMNEILANAPTMVDETVDKTIAPLKYEMMHKQEIFANAPAEYVNFAQFPTMSEAPPEYAMTQVNKFLATTSTPHVYERKHRYEISTHNPTMPKYEYEMVHPRV